MAVLDPTRLVQPALERAEWIAERSAAELLLYCCCYDSRLAFDQHAKIANVERTRSWLERLAAGTRGRGTRASIEVGWDPEWRDAMARAAIASGSQLVVKTANRQTALARHLMKTTDFTLLGSMGCPTLLVSPNAPQAPNVVLAAVKLGARTAAGEPDAAVIAAARGIADALGAELHAVTVTEGPAASDDRQALAERCSLPHERTHVAAGPVPRAIAEVAVRLGVGVLVVGCAPEGLDDRARIIGATAERIVDAVDADIVVVPG